MKPYSSVKKNEIMPFAGKGGKPDSKGQGLKVFFHNED